MPFRHSNSHISNSNRRFSTVFGCFWALLRRTTSGVLCCGAMNTRRAAVVAIADTHDEHHFPAQ